MRSKKMKGGKMVLTISEAEEMDCPTQSDGMQAIRCRGADCPAWRWWDRKERSVHLPDRQTFFSMTGIDQNKDDVEAQMAKWAEGYRPKGEGWYLSLKAWAWRLSLPDGGRRGYCGLAGKPDYE